MTEKTHDVRRLSAGTRLFLTIFVGLMVLSVTGVGATAAAVYRSGSIAVQVEPDDGSSISVKVPAFLAHIAILLAPDDVLDELGRELRPVWPVVQAAARELDRTPDFVLLEVQSSDEHVIVEKSRGRLAVRVETAGERVNLAVPLRTVRLLADRLGGLSV